MCGITGFVDFSRNSTLSDLKAMTHVIEHRGPDDVGTEWFDTQACSLGLGFRRLAIIDLSPLGHQPMHNPADGCWIVFNGEVYNFKEIRKELEGNGHAFISHSDTEVILKAYQHWGMSCVDRFIGMFAMALYNPKEDKLILLRDRAGVKPLYYHWNEKILLFGSELKTFHRHPQFKKEIDLNVLSSYFQFGYVPAPASIFKNTYKLSPGHYLILDLKSQEIQIHKYWDAADAYKLPKLNISLKEAENKTEEILTSAFQYRMISDVPVGVFLSGGYDSSCVTALLQKNSATKIKTFRTDHHEFKCTFKEAMDIVPALPEIYDEPFGDPSAIPTTLVSRIARQHVTVALSADAGDELFAGYPRHRKSLSYLKKLKRLPAGISSSISRLIPGSGEMDFNSAHRMGKLKEVLSISDPVVQFNSINSFYSIQERQQLLNKVRNQISKPGILSNESVNGNLDLLSRMLLSEYKTYLSDDILHKVDRATMSVGLEGREPFLDHRILEYVAQLPSEYKMNDHAQKILLKKIVHKYIPESIMDRPKMGFGIPLQDWFKADPETDLYGCIGSTKNS
ncbi:MAG: asparagine synthase (glutamine-hydrolyzing) [Bacteroidetes bacterium]|nr:asparagine synthase (glutamine-hydrolyzing) [Bacteroidota bacterium]